MKTLKTAKANKILIVLFQRGKLYFFLTGRQLFLLPAKQKKIEFNVLYFIGSAKSSALRPKLKALRAPYKTRQSKLPASRALLAASRAKSAVLRAKLISSNAKQSGLPALVVSSPVLVLPALAGKQITPVERKGRMAKLSAPPVGEQTAPAKLKGRMAKLSAPPAGKQTAPAQFYR